MGEKEKEVAFLRGLTIEPEYTQRFTDFLDESVDFGTPATLTYLNAGAGNHAIEISEKLGSRTEVFPVCETAELQEHAQLKADAAKVELDFSTKRPLGESAFVVSDMSLDDPAALTESIRDSAAASNDRIVFFLPTAGSFGEVFSYLWEVLLDLGIEGKDERVGQLIDSLPTISAVEDEIRNQNLREIKSHVKSEIFEFENGRAFEESLLVTRALFPRWSGFLDENEKERVIKKLAQKIDEDCEGLTFRFTVKTAVFEARH